MAQLNNVPPAIWKLSAIAKAIRIPIILYSVQGRTGVNIEPATVARLAQVDNIIGIKEASGNITQIADVIHRVPADFIVLSGDDAMTLPVIALGGRGIVSVASNQIPGAMSELARLAKMAADANCHDAFELTSDFAASGVKIN